MLVLAGLGNPGAKYERNRHNIGFMAMDAIAARWGFGPERKGFQALVRAGDIPTPGGAVRAILLKPQTFMNDSGRSVGEALKFYKVEPPDMTVFYDELDLSPGRFRMKAGGGAAGHNGIRSIIAHVGPHFRRARMGIGHPGHKDRVMGHVLSDFHKVDQDWLAALCKACAEALPLLAVGEDEKYQTEVMRLAPAEKLDARKQGEGRAVRMLGLPLPMLGLSLIFAIAMCVHVVRSGREMFWLWIILVFQPFGAIIYFIAIVLPSISGGPTARKMGAAARETLDPGREYRQAKAAADDSPTVHNRMRLGAAAGELGRWDEAEALYREAAQGVHAEDPALMLGLAHARVELGRYDEALPILSKLSAAGDPARSPQIGLLFARVYEGLGRTGEADEAYRTGAMRLPGLEGIARYAAFLGRSGRTAEAQDLLAEIDRRVQRTNHRFMKEARTWRDLAARGREGR